MTTRKWLPQLLQKNKYDVGAPEMGHGHLGGLRKEPRETQHSVAAFMFCSFVYPDLFLKRKLKPRAQPEAFQQQAPHLGWEGWHHLELCWGTAQPSPAQRRPSVHPSCPSKTLGCFHDSLFPCIKGMTYTEMSSPEPSRSLDIRHPLSFRTPRARITRSWAASVYL